jgi:hypothetical protein
LSAVPVTPGQSFVTGETRRLFPLQTAGFSPAIDVASDGRVLAIRAAGAAATRPDELILVENFTEELKAKVKPK